MTAEFYSSDAFPTLEAARAWLAKAIWGKGGAICPCCDRFDSVFDRKVNLASVKVLARLYWWTQRHGDGFHHYRYFIKGQNGRDFTAYFIPLNLIERKPLDPKNKKQKTSGMYRITDRGRAFVEGRLAIATRVVLYHNEPVRLSEEHQHIAEFWPGFDYQELMNT